MRPVIGPRPISFPQIAAHRYPSNVWDQGWEPVRDLEIFSIHFPPSLFLFPLIFLLIRNTVHLFLFSSSLSLSLSVPPFIFFWLCISLFLFVSWSRIKKKVIDMQMDGGNSIFCLLWGRGDFYEVRIAVGL